MRWDFGKVYKEIRKAKGLSQKEVCGNQLSRTSLSKFEACQSIPSIENMIFLLNQINMSMEEFKFICNVYQPSKRQKIFNKAYHHLSASDTEGLRDIQQLCKEHLKTHHDLPIEWMLDIVTVAISVREHGFLEPTEELQTVTKKVWCHLEKQDVWYERDLKMLNAILFQFPVEQLPKLTESILASLQKYEHYLPLADVRHNLLSNLSTIYLYKGYMKECEQLTQLTYELAKDTKRYDRLGFSQVRLGICQKDELLIEKGLQLLELTDEYALLENCQEEYKQFYKK